MTAGEEMATMKELLIDIPKLFGMDMTSFVRKVRNITPKLKSATSKEAKLMAAMEIFL